MSVNSYVSGKIIVGCRCRFFSRACKKDNSESLSEKGVVYPVKDEKTGEVICVLDIYRTLTQNQNSETKEMEYIIKYEMFAHQVNYTYLKNAFKGTIDDEDIIFKKNNPALVVNFYPTAELKSEEALLNNTEAVLDNNGKLKTGIAIYDYKSNPEKDGENPYLVQLNYFRETNLTDSKALFDDKAYVAVTAQLPITVQEDGYDADYTKTLNYNLFEGEIENFVLKGTELNKEDIKNLSTIYHTSRHDEKEEYLKYFQQT